MQHVICTVASSAEVDVNDFSTSRFLTKEGRRICSSPNSDLSKRAMAKVDREKRGLGKVEMKEEKRDTTSHGPVVSHEPHKGSKRGQRQRLNKRRRNRKPGQRGQRGSAKKVQ